MTLRQLGSSDLRITRVGIGAWAMGGGKWEFGWGPQADDASIAIFRLLGLATSIASGCVVRCLSSVLPMRIALDAMGGDYAPKNTIEGAALALKGLPEIEKLVLVGSTSAVEAELQRLYYDTANATHPASMAALLKLVPASQVTYGTDYPYFPLDQINNLRKLDLAPADLEAISSGNASRLCPKVA